MLFIPIGFPDYLAILAVGNTILWNHNSASIIELNIIVNYIIQYLKKKYFMSTYFFLNQTIPFPSHILASGHVTIPVQGISKINPGCGFHPGMHWTMFCPPDCNRQAKTSKHLNPLLMSDPKKKTKCRLMWSISHWIILICCDWWELRFQEDSKLFRSRFR